MTTPIRQLHESLRPREELMRRGAANADDATLLAVLLRSGTRGQNVKDLATEIIQKFNGFEGLVGTSFDSLRESLLAKKIKGLGKVKILELSAALEIGRRAANQRRAAEPPAMDTPEAAHRLLKPLAEDTRDEHFWVLPLDAKNRLIGAPMVIAKGTVNTAGLHPRDVFAPLLRLGAAGFICAHNHPSGDTIPSEQDLSLTQRLLDTAAILNVSLHDHIIVGCPSPKNPAGFLSLRAAGLANFKQ